MIRSEVDFEAEGKHTGFLRLAHSTHESAYGWIPIPVASVRNGAGPTVLSMADTATADQVVAAAPKGWLVHRLDVDREGARLVPL